MLLWKLSSAGCGHEYADCSCASRHTGKRPSCWLWKKCPVFHVPWILKMKIHLLQFCCSFQVGTVIYRLRASDSDNNFPLAFEVVGALGKTLLDIEFLGCSVPESLCQANVVLRKPLDRGRTYDFQIRVQDTTGDFTRVKASITSTDGTAFTEVMLGEKLLRVPEVRTERACRHVLKQKPDQWTLTFSFILNRPWELWAYLLRSFVIIIMSYINIDR